MESPVPETAGLGLLPLVGVWRGRGRGGYEPVEKDFTYGHEIRFSHDGRPFLYYESRIWILDDDDKPVRMAGREIGLPVSGCSSNFTPRRCGKSESQICMR